MDEKKKRKDEDENEDTEESLEADKKENSEDLLQKNQELEDKYKRALADYQNLVRRTQDEKREWARLSNKDLVLKLLPILDTLMLAEKHTNDDNFKLTVQQFLQVLKDEGIEKIPTVGEDFNPEEMEVVSTQDGENGKVIDEMRAGYMLYDLVLRPAQVIVGKKE